jgi:hypothetical protein
MNGPFEAGEKILLVDQRDRRYLLTLQTGETWHSHGGGVPHDLLIGSPEGTLVHSATGMAFRAFRPRLADFVLKMPRGAQLVYPKDVGAILIGPWAFAIFAGIVVLFALGEFYLAVQKRHYQPATALGLVSGALVLGAGYYRGENAMLAIVALSLFATFLWYMTVPVQHRRNLVSNIPGASATATHVVALVLIVLMVAATYTTQRQVMLRNTQTLDSQQAMIQKLMLYGVPASLTVSGFFFPIGVLFYWSGRKTRADAVDLTLAPEATATAL